MKIALVGYGKMGTQIEQLASSHGCTIVARISRKEAEGQNFQKAIKEADVCIDFSHPEMVLSNIKHMAQAGKNIVVGTTGWYDHVDDVRALVKSSGIGMLYSPNFSIGVTLFLKIVAEAASLINSFDDYDVGIIEAHHNKKVDQPSGTAKAIKDNLIQICLGKNR